MLPRIRVVPILDAKNQYTVVYSDGVAFQSYSVIVAYVNSVGVLTFTKYWNYSQTTRKYLYEWLHMERFACNGYTSVEVLKALSSKNKTKALQHLIDIGLIQYDETEQ